MTYGINRVPRDVDPTSEAMAELEAAEIVASQPERGYQPRCCELGCGKPISPKIWRSGTPGSMVCCEEHWLAYHRGSAVVKNHTADPASASVEEVLEAYASIGRDTGSCARCGKRDSDWNSGAGTYLCSRHWDEY